MELDRARAGLCGGRRIRAALGAVAASKVEIEAIAGAVCSRRCPVHVRPVPGVMRHQNVAGARSVHGADRELRIEVILQMRRGNPTGDGMRGVVERHGRDQDVGRIVVIMHGEVVDALIKHVRADPARLCDGQRGAVVIFVNDNIAVVGRALPGERRLVGDVDRVVGGEGDDHLGDGIAGDAGCDGKMINVGRCGICDKNGPVAVGKLVDKRRVVAVAVATTAEPVKAVRGKLIRLGRAVGRITRRGDEVIAISNVGRRIVRAQVGREIVVIIVAVIVPDQIHL